jgi:hypothetical protein
MGGKKTALRSRRHAKTPLFEDGLAATLLRIHEFAQAVHRSKFKVSASALLGADFPETTLELVHRLAVALCSDLPNSEFAVATKSLQEMLFAATSLDATLPTAAFARKLKGSLLSKGSKGWIALFLSFYTENVLRLKLDVKPTAAEIEAAVRLSIRSMRPWPTLTLARAETLIESLQTHVIDNRLRSR